MREGSEFELCERQLMVIITLSHIVMKKSNQLGTENNKTGEL